MALMEETAENRLKRLRMRSWRRGTKEMDLILGGFADACLSDLNEAELDAYENLLIENDQDLYQWMSGQAEIPAEHAKIAEKIRGIHKILDK